MEAEQIIAIVVALAGGLGLQQIWGLVKSKLDISAKKDEVTVEYERGRILELEKRNEELSIQITELSIKVAKLEERILYTAKTRVKGH